MDNFEFMGYLSTPDESYFIGIATVRLYSKIILRYKIVNRKDGSGYFVAASNYKLPSENGYKYVDSFTLDSIMENDELREFIRSNVNKSMNGNTDVSPDNQKEQQHNQFHQPEVEACPF